jgi:hypothetical protein
MRQPAAFSEDAIVALAELGAFELEREVRARVAGWRPGDAPPTLSAARRALDGDASARDVLLAALERDEPGLAPFVERMAAAAGLAALGDPNAWQSALADLDREARAFLSEGQLGMAADWTTTLEFLLDALARPDPSSIRVAHLLPRLGEVHARSAPPKTAAEVERRLDGLRGR